MASLAMGKKKTGRPATSTREDTTIRFDKQLAIKARHVADVRGITVAEYVSELARVAVDQDYAEATGRLDGRFRGTEGDLDDSGSASK